MTDLIFLTLSMFYIGLVVLTKITNAPIYQVLGGLITFYLMIQFYNDGNVLIGFAFLGLTLWSFGGWLRD